MIGILLVSHGKMAEGIKDSIEMIVGKVEKLITLALIPGQDIMSLNANILAKTKELDSGDGVIIFVDLFGASPYNASMQCLPQWTNMDIKISIITGMSLPMVITAVCHREFSNLGELTQDIINTGVENIKDAIAELKITTNLNGDEDDY